MADLSVQQQIQAYKKSNPKVKNLSDKEVLSIMLKNGQIKLTEEQKIQFLLILPITTTMKLI